MTNDYFNHTVTVTRNTLARASQVNSIFQSIEAGLDKLPGADPLNQGRVTYVADSGAANAYVVTLSKAPSSYTEGLSFVMKAANTNTGASTVNVNGLGVKSIKTFDGSDVPAGYIRANGLHYLQYNGSNFILIGPTDSAASAALAKDWATTLAALVAGTDYSAKEYAIGDLEAAGGSAKAWAQDASAPDGGSTKSAKSHAADSAASAAAASTSESNASTSETNAAASEAKAQLWADEVEDTPVETGKFSAKHWAAKAATFRNIGEVFAIQTDILGHVKPDNSGAAQFIELTAGLDGVGQYNEGLLTSESVSGSSPEVVATAEISHAASPMDGQTVRLINTEERFLRAGNAGVAQDSLENRLYQFQTNNAGSVSPSYGTVTVPDSGSMSAWKFTSGGNDDQFGTDKVRIRMSLTGTETRPRNVGTTYYMRIA